MASLTGQVQGSIFIIILLIQISTSLEKELYYIKVAFLCSNYQGCPTSCHGTISACTSIKKCSSTCGITIITSQVQGGMATSTSQDQGTFPIIILPMHISASLEQELQCIEVTLLCSSHQGCPTTFLGVNNVCTC
ncbi:unnamed protein product [Chrysoparadoxa australica]